MYAEERTSLASINEEELSTILKFDAMTNKRFLENNQFQNNISQRLYTQRGRKCKESSTQSCQRLVVCCCLTSLLSVFVKTILVTMTSRVTKIKEAVLIHYLRKRFLLLY